MKNKFELNMEQNILMSMDEVRTQLSSTESMIKNAEDELKSLKETLSKTENFDFLQEENETLNLIHNMTLEDIKIYNEKILQLEEMSKTNETILLKLKKENEELQKIKNMNKQKSKINKNLIFNIKDLSRSIGLKNIKDSKFITLKNINNKINNKENKKIVYTEKVNNIIKGYEKSLNEIKNDANKINSTLKEQIKIIDGYRKYLNEINGFIIKHKERLTISIDDVAIIDDNNTNNKLQEIIKLIEKVPLLLFELDDILSENKDNLGQNIENILENVQTNINKFKLEENQDENKFNNICDEINQIVGVIDIIFNDFNDNKNKFDSKNILIEEEIKKIKDIQNQIITKNEKEIENNSNNIINEKNNNVNNNKIINNERKKKFIEQSFLFNVKNISKKLELLKTINLFKNDDKSEKNLKNFKILKKNYHEICYIYDDYQIHDIYYILKVVGLAKKRKITKSSYSFDSFYNIEIQEFSLNDIPSNYSVEESNIIKFAVNLSNLETVKVHIKIKAKKRIYYLSKESKEENKIYREDYYGLSSNLAGEKAKYSLILKGSFDIVNFKEFFLIRNINNKEESEYTWGGIVPSNGKGTTITFSKKEAIFSFKQEVNIKFNEYVKDTKIFIPIEFVGGNNEIINIIPSSPQTTDIILDEENRRYIFNFLETNYKSIKMVIKGELRNKCKGDWNVDLIDEQIENLMPREDVKDKEKLKIIAKKIINEFDKKNKNTDFEFLDYMKIGLWVYENIEYDLKYIGTNYSALNIYKMKKGVCHHFTKLCNALLYSLGYKVIYVTGYPIEGKTFSLKDLHAFSLIQLDNNQWFPFDATWGILTGKLLVGHVFRMFGNSTYNWDTYLSINSHSKTINGKFIQ